MSSKAEQILLEIVGLEDFFNLLLRKTKQSQIQKRRKEDIDPSQLRLAYEEVKQLKEHYSELERALNRMLLEIINHAGLTSKSNKISRRKIAEGTCV